VVRVEERGNGVVVRTEYPRTDSRSLEYALNLAIAAPEAAPLDVSNRFGHVTGTRLARGRQRKTIRTVT
jgi:hypothetical protein